MLQNHDFAAISGYFTRFEISKKLFVVGLGTLWAIQNNVIIICMVLGTSKKIYLKFGEIAVFHNFMIFYLIPKNFGPMFLEVKTCLDMNRFNSGY